MDDRKGEFALGEILTKSLVLGISRIGEIAVIVQNLEEQTNGVDQGNIIGW